MPAQAECGGPDDCGSHDGEHQRERPSQPWRKLILGVEKADRISADSKIGAVSERNLAGITPRMFQADPIAPKSSVRIIRFWKDGAAKIKGYTQERQARPGRSEAARPQWLSCGRASFPSQNAIGPEERDEQKKCVRKDVLETWIGQEAAIDLHHADDMPPQNAPVTLPNPPIATATKAGSTQRAPICGFTAKCEASSPPAIATALALRPQASANSGRC